MVFQQGTVETTKQYLINFPQMQNHQGYLLKLYTLMAEFLGGPVVETPCYLYRGHPLAPQLGSLGN